MNEKPSIGFPDIKPDIVGYDNVGVVKNIPQVCDKRSVVLGARFVTLVIRESPDCYPLVFQRLVGK